MVPATLEFLCGLAIAAVTIADVFSSILVPGPADSPLRVATRLRIVSLPLWRWLSRRRSEGRTRLSNSFAPLLFSLAFLGWLLFLVLAFGLMLHALSSDFTPRLQGFSHALYVSGAYVLTVGVSDVQPHGLARWLLLAAALCGFGVITATITFILEIQSNLHEREAGVLKLSGLAGNPPSGVGLLETFASLGLRNELGHFFKEWADWSAAVLNSHVSFPVLVYFHSIDSESDWVTALEIVLDAATLMMALIDEDCGLAVLLHRSGSRTAAHLSGLFHLRSEHPGIADESAVRALSNMLRKAGYRVLPVDSAVVGRFFSLRSDYSSRLRALAQHLGSMQCPLNPRSEEAAGPRETCA